MDEYRVYPNAAAFVVMNFNSKVKSWRMGLGRPPGPIRSGRVERNADTVEQGTAGFFAVVTRESEGMARFYIYYVAPSDIPMWEGPYTAHSEEILEMDER